MEGIQEAQCPLLYSRLCCATGIMYCPSGSLARVYSLLEIMPHQRVFKGANAPQTKVCTSCCFCWLSRTPKNPPPKKKKFQEINVCYFWTFRNVFGCFRWFLFVCFGFSFGLSMSERYSCKRKWGRNKQDREKRIRMPIMSKQTWSTVELTVIELFTCETSPSVNYLCFCSEFELTGLSSIFLPAQHLLQAFLNISYHITYKITRTWGPISAALHDITE